MQHERFMAKGKIEMVHEYVELPDSDDSTMKHYELESNAKGQLVLTDSTLQGPQLPPHFHGPGLLSKDAHRIEAVEVFEINPIDLVRLIRQHGVKLSLQSSSNGDRPRGQHPR